jgi:nucleoside-diphosphate-sugar epimerase
MVRMGDAAAMMGFRPQVVVHMAAWINAGIVADHRTYRDNVAGAFNVASAAASARAARVILGSSAQVYGFAEHAPVAVTVSEEHPLRRLNAYALSKMAAEEIGRYIGARTDTCVLSFGIMGALVAEAMAQEVADLRADPASGRFLLWTRVDVRDVARACLLAVEADLVPGGAYNITGASILVPGMTRDLLERHCPGLNLARRPHRNPDALRIA